MKANTSVNPTNRRKLRRGRPYGLDRKAYKHVRSSVERFFAWLKSFRRITMRYERLKTTFLGPIQMACILIHLRVCNEFTDYYLTRPISRIFKPNCHLQV